MVASISKAMNASTLEQYHSKDNYYSQGEGLENSQWQGSFAAHQGLEGSIHKADWQQACKGNDPQGNELRRKQNNSRAGWDITLSAPKSASLKALIDQDDRVLEAHRKAVQSTVQYIEQNCIYAQVKDQGQLKREQTQKGQFALFEHDDNRKQEPQLHTHIVILNQTLCQDGKTRTLDSRELFIQKKTIGAYYDHTFAHHLKEQGFEIEWTAAHTFEISGYQKDQLEAFSGRRQQIREHLAAQNIAIEHATAQQKEIACLESRSVKLHKNEPIDREIQQMRWEEESDRLGIIHPQPIETLNQLYELDAHPGSLNETITASIESATAYKVALTRQELLRVALAHTQEHYSPSELEPALNNHSALIQTQDGRLTTQQTLEREQFILKTANETQNTQPSLSTPEQIAQVAQATQLNEGQTQALHHIATSSDLITLVQGNAGAGKTYMLNAFRECLSNEAQTRLRGLAPSAAAAETLETETSVPSTTLDRYLFTSNDQTPRNETLLIDEAGMISSQQMERLIRKAQATESRIILVGDTQQLNSIEAGAPFRLLQERSTLKTATLSENLRQKTPHLFVAANLAAEQQTNEALETLDRYQSIQEIPDLNQRNHSVAEQYLAREPREQARTLILCDTNQDRQAITDQIRANYIANGILGETARTIQILYPKKLDPQAITQAYSYQKGDAIRFTRLNLHFPDAYYRVAEVQAQSLILKDRTGQLQEMSLNEYKEREVYQYQSLEIRTGDRLRFTRNQRTRNQTNGQPYTIEALNPDNTIEIRTKGQRYTVTANQLLHSDYAYCRTVYSAQGWTSAEAIWAPQHNPGREQTYVALTRAKESLQILTLNRAALGLSAQTTQRQENALDLIESITPSIPALKLEPETTQPTETQQLSLFSGMTDDLKRKVKPQSTRSEPTQRSDRPSPNPAASPEHRNDPSQIQQTSRQQGQAEPTRATDGVSAPSDIAPVRSRFADIAERARALSEQLERSRRKPEHPQQPDGADAGIDSNPATDLREQHLEPQPAHPTQSEPRNPTAAINPGNSDTQTTEPAIHPADEPRLEPDQSVHPQTSESLESDTGLTQRSATQHQNRLDHPHERDRPDGSIGDGVSRTIPERSIQPNVGAHEQTAQQPRDSDEQTAQTPEVEDPAVKQIQQHLQIAQNWSDAELLSIATAVEDYFRAPPPKPDMARGKQLKAELGRLMEQDSHLLNTIAQQLDRVETLGVARSIWNPFGSNPKDIKAAQEHLEQSKSQRVTLGRQIQQTQSSFASWQAAAKTYLKWDSSDEGKRMHQCRAIVQLEPVQQRITQIHQAQEQIRQAQEKERKRQEALEILRDWKQTAIKLGRPEAYVQRIQEITDDYKKNKPLNENQIEHMSQDFAAHREQIRQAEAQQQRQRGFSL
jgi:conjugative relaxase-like TrwC/TraI family protein